MNYREALAWLYGTQRFGIKLGLENTERLLASLPAGVPAARIIHVAGTNGKGSVCALLDAVSCAAGWRTGLFTSPHLVTFRERIQLSGELISENDVARGLTRTRDLIAAWSPHPTFFEITTALALQYFTERDAEIVVLETGLGGRWDATNAVSPTVCAITPIDLDHQAWLGNTIAEIAAEKAGIIKPGVPVVSAPQLPEAEAVLRAQAAQMNAPITFVDSVQAPRPVALSGHYQQQNAAVAIAALVAGKISVTDDAIARGLASVQWPARFQRWDDRTVIDGAHNPAGARVLAETWQQTFANHKAALILGILRDKDAAGIFAALEPIAGHLFIPRQRSERAHTPGDLAAIIARTSPHHPTTLRPSFASALIAARATGHPVLITGSLHFAGEALATLRGDPDSFENALQ